MINKKELLEEILNMIELSTDRMKVCKPSKDYYSRENDWSEDEIEFINPDKLTNSLKKAIEENS